MKWLLFIPWSILLIAAAASAISVVYARHMNRQLFHQLEQLERERDALNIEYGQLQLERATWADNNRIEDIAQTKLNMIFPTQDTTRIVRLPQSTSATMRGTP